jgi:hypothetical protein
MTSRLRCGLAPPTAELGCASSWRERRPASSECTLTALQRAQRPRALQILSSGSSMSGRHRCSRPPMGQASTASPRPPAELKRADANARHTPSHVSRGSVREGIGLRTSCLCVCRSYNKTHERRDQHYFMRVLLLAQHHQQRAGNAGVVGRGGRYRPAPKRDAEVLEETPNSNPNIAAAFATSHDLAVICLRSVLQELTKKRPGDGDKSG